MRRLLAAGILLSLSCGFGLPTIRAPEVPAQPVPPLTGKRIVFPRAFEDGRGGPYCGHWVNQETGERHDIPCKTPPPAWLADLLRDSLRRAGCVLLEEDGTSHAGALKLRARLVRAYAERRVEAFAVITEAVIELELSSWDATDRPVRLLQSKGEVKAGVMGTGGDFQKAFDRATVPLVPLMTKVVSELLEHAPAGAAP